MRTRNLLSRKDRLYDSKTELQWRKEGLALVDGAVGEEMWINGYRQYTAVYFAAEDTRPATPDDLERWKAEKREKSKARERARRERLRVEMELRRKKAQMEERLAQERKERLLRLQEIDKARVICLDVETTGFSSLSDEILQMSIIDGNGVVLFNEYIRPVNKSEWQMAERVNGISPEMVADKPTISEHITRLNEIIAAADLIVGYNSASFDLPFVRAAGITVPKEIQHVDVMIEFAPVYGEESQKGGYKWQNLATCADFYGYEGEGDFHDSLEDVRATLHCYFAMLEDLGK